MHLAMKSHINQLFMIIISNSLTYVWNPLFKMLHSCICYGSMLHAVRQNSFGQNMGVTLNYVLTAINGMEES